MPPRLTRFRCWWCQRVLGVRKLHHEVVAGDRVRRCCHECYLREGSNYLLVYEDEVQEKAEVWRVLRRQLECGR